MAQAPESSIRVNYTQAVGHLHIDPEAIRGEGGPSDPRLVVTVAVELSPQPPDRTLAMLDLGARLFVGSTADPAKQVGPPVRVHLMDGLPVRSQTESGVLAHDVYVRFPLTAASVRRIEATRHASEGADMMVQVALDARIAWLQFTYGQRLPGIPPDDDPFQGHLGLHSTFSYFRQVEIDALTVGVAQSTWLNQVLPGLGIDHLRLVELAFPPDLAGIGNAATAFDAAQRAYQQRRYEDCIDKCRGIVLAWNKHYGTTKDRHLAPIVGDARHWANDDPRQAFLDRVWQALTDAVNVPHHPEDQPSPYRPTAPDAQLVLRLVAILSEYLAA